MPVSASIDIQTLRGVQRQLSPGAMVPLLWQALRVQWRRSADRETARWVRDLDHPGISEDYRTACRGNYR